jgi:hypothetical protein
MEPADHGLKPLENHKPKYISLPLSQLPEISYCDFSSTVPFNQDCFVNLASFVFLNEF